MSAPLCTVIVTVFSPMFHVAGVPLACVVPFTFIVTVPVAADAVMVFVAFIVLAS